MVNLDKEKYTKIFLILSFFSCWISISTSAFDIYKIFNLYKNNITETNSTVLPTFNELVNFLRQLIMFIIFPILLIINFLKIKIKKASYDFPFLCLFFYFISQQFVCFRNKSQTGNSLWLRNKKYYFWKRCRWINVSKLNE